MRITAPALLTLLAATPAISADFPVTVQSCDRQVTVAAPPARAVATGSNLIEMMLALGLEDHLTGVTGRPERVQASADLFPAALGLRSLQNQGLTLEVLLAEQVDFLFAGWSYGLRVGGDITPETLQTYEIPVYELSESCIRLGQKNPPSFDYLYRDLTNLAAIFGVPERAGALLADYRQRLAAVAERVREQTHAPRIFIYDSGDRVAVSAGRYAMPQAIIEAAGGQNILEDMDSSWVRVDWETVIDREPEVIVIVDYGTVTADQKIDLMRANPAFSHVPAIRDNRFLVLSYDELTPGPRNVIAVERLADFLFEG